jgi:hypothetical protein
VNADFYVREYLGARYTTSQIRYITSLSDLVKQCKSNAHSWIGSTQLLLVLSIGLVSGRGFDTGYLCVNSSWCPASNNNSPLSYHLMIGGSFLLVFCIFMLSLSQPGQYYQVRFCRLCNTLPHGPSGFPYARAGGGHCCRHHLCTELWAHITLLSAPSSNSHGDRRFGGLTFHECRLSFLLTIYRALHLVEPCIPSCSTGYFMDL